MQNSIRLIVVFILFAPQVFVPTGEIFAAELTKAEKKTRVKIENIIRSAGREYSAGKFDQAGKSVRRAMVELDSATKGGSGDMLEALQPAIKRIARAHTLLEFEGVALPPFRAPSAPQSTTVRPSDGESEKMKRAESTEPPGIGFTDSVAPILVRRCGRCHIADAKGKFSMASYAALMKGPPEGVVVFAGDVTASRLVETIETGDMPRGGGKVTPQELATLKAWIENGARFDQTDPTASLGNPDPKPETTTPMVRKATGNESVSFAKQVAPLLIEHCKGCHLEAMTTRGGLRMDTFAQLLRGGGSGPVIQPGDGKGSLLIGKLRGTEGQRMPAGGRPPLPESSIELVEKWIDEGATLDGASESQPLTVMSQLAWANSASSDEISARREATIKRDLTLALPNSDSISSTATENFYVTGPVTQRTIDAVARQAENQIELVSAAVVPAGSKVYRGKATIVVMPKRYNYSEFAKMIERRSLPSGWTSHWKFDGINAYIALVATDRDDDATIAERLASPLISLAVATQGTGVPDWFAEGVGAAKTKRKPTRGDRNAKQQADAELRAAIAAVPNARQFLAGNLPPEQATLAANAIVSSLLAGKQRRSYDKMMRSLADGMTFEQAFVAGYSMPIETYVERWLAASR